MSGQQSGVNATGLPSQKVRAAIMRYERGQRDKSGQMALRAALDTDPRARNWSARGSLIADYQGRAGKVSPVNGDMSSQRYR